MTTAAEDVLALARRELGVRESPPGSNCVKYNTAYYGRTVTGAAYPWCCVFIWWLFQRAGLSALFYGGCKTASCGTLVDLARQAGRFETGGYRPGDLVFFHFSGPEIQHIGLLEKVRPDGALVTIEGNTGAGQDADGGQVQRRVRPIRVVAGAFRPAYGEEDTVTQEQFDAMMDAWLDERTRQAPGASSEEARAWAEQAGIIRGDGDAGYRYRSFCTREQVAVFLQRLAEYLKK